MAQEHAAQTVLRLMKPLFGFARSRSATIQDAEDITQDIVLKLYRALHARDDIVEPEKYAWTIAHNVLANYYRSRAGYGKNVPIHGLADVLPAEDDMGALLEERETTTRLYNEIAYLSKTQRRIVIMFYFEGKRQTEIAKTLGLPLGTVKWHLSNAKTDLQKGMDRVRTNTELKFNPVKFNMISTNGSTGTMGGNASCLRSTLAQNILYLTRAEAMSVNAIADVLAVSPVYVEGEVEFLEENGFMLQQGKGYIANILLDVPTTESNRQMSDMYEKAADIFAPAIFDALMAQVKLGEGGVVCPRNDINFAMWALVPYVTAWSGTPDARVTFEEAATIRPDGGINICHCTVQNTDAQPIKYSEEKMGGPSWNGGDDVLLWMMDTLWGGDRVGNYHPDIMNHDLSSMRTFFDGALSDDEAARMAERGFISRKQVSALLPGGGRGVTTTTPGSFGSYSMVDETATIDTLDIVWLTKEASQRLIALANTLRDKHQAELDALKSSFIERQLINTPQHLKKARAYGLQHLFHSDGHFIIYLLNKLIEDGKLQLPTEEQRNSLCAVVVSG